jgi:hypothetical protein
VPKKPLDPKAKAKRQKVIAGVGGVVLLGLLAFQIPRTMKLLHQGQTSQQSTPTTTTAAPAPGTTVPLAPPSLGGGTSGSAPAAPAGTPSAEGLVDSDMPPQPAAGQLVSFGRFQSKDPFAPQVDASCSGASCAGSSGSSSTVPTTSPRVAPQPAPTPARPGTSGSSTGAAQLTAARISLNGVAETVAVGQAFPQSDPLFRLVSLTRTTAKIAIAGGSYEDGRPAVTLKKGKPVTLMNTADGARYQLLLISIS